MLALFKGGARRMARSILQGEMTKKIVRPWILLTGFWFDGGIWKDDATWNDGAKRKGGKR